MKIIVQIVLVSLVSILPYESVSAFSMIPSLSTSPMSMASTRLYADSVVEKESEMMGGAAISGLTSGLETVFTTEQIDAILPHRYPFALVDKVVEYEAGKRAVGIKSVTKVC
jgi:hypothetical protein